MPYEMWPGGVHPAAAVRSLLTKTMIIVLILDFDILAFFYHGE
jgi:hypothetical protein